MVTILCNQWYVGNTYMEIQHKYKINIYHCFTNKDTNSEK